MLFVEEGIQKPLDEIEEMYRKKFEKDLPIYEYLDITAGDGYDISMAGVTRLRAVIEKQIRQGKTPELPKDYHDRLY